MIMDDLTLCPGCNKQYTLKNPVKKLKNCAHVLCVYCIKTSALCPQDQIKIQQKKYQIKNFQEEQTIMNLIRNKIDSKEIDKNIKDIIISQNKSNKKITNQENIKKSQNQQIKEKQNIEEIFNNNHQLSESDILKQTQEKSPISPTKSYSKTQNSRLVGNQEKNQNQQKCLNCNKHSQQQLILDFETKDIIQKQQIPEQEQSLIEQLSINLQKDKPISVINEQKQDKKTIENQQVIENKQIIDTKQQIKKNQIHLFEHKKIIQSNIGNDQQETKQIKLQNNDQKQYQDCLLHSKIADLVCNLDGQLICSSCALFGEHKGHPILSSEQFIKHLNTITTQTLNKFEQIKHKQQNLNHLTINNYIKQQYRMKRQNEIINIENIFFNLRKKISQYEQQTLLNLNLIIENSQQFLRQNSKISELEIKKSQWYAKVEKLGTVMEQVYNSKNFNNAINYLNKNSEQSFIVKQGEYLDLQYNSLDNIIKNKIKSTCEQLQIHVSKNLEEALAQYCTFTGNHIGLCLNNYDKISMQNSTYNNYNNSINNNYNNSVNINNNSINNNHQNNNSHKKQNKMITMTPDNYNYKQYKQNDKYQDDFLLETQSKWINNINDQNNIISNQEYQNYENYLLEDFNLKKQNKYNQSCQYLKLPDIENEMNQIQYCERKRSFQGNNINKQIYTSRNRNRSRSRKRIDSKEKYACTSNFTVERDLLNTINDQNKKKKKLQIPEKYKNIYQDLKLDRLEIIDFSGAELGDNIIISLCDIFIQSQKIRSLKLIRNKITDEIFQQIIFACRKLNSLNLAQNYLTEKSLDLLLECSLGQLKNITLSLNKINRRNVKGKLEKLKKNGIIVSI